MTPPPIWPDKVPAPPRLRRLRALWSQAMALWSPHHRDVRRIAARYEQEYTFMAVNAVVTHCLLSHKVGLPLDWALKPVHDELLLRGHRAILNRDEYDRKAAEAGVPPAYVKLLFASMDFQKGGMVQ